MASTFIMGHGQGITDEAIWELAQKPSFVSPPQGWLFGTNSISFGNSLYHINENTAYELALLDIHAQYWEATSPDHLRRYYRGLQYNVERSLTSTNALEVHCTPSFLFPWLARTIFRMRHNKQGRQMMSQVLKDIPEAERSKLQTGDFEANGIHSYLHTFPRPLAEGLF
jgi:hypothetical protein